MNTKNTFSTENYVFNKSIIKIGLLLFAFLFYGPASILAQCNPDLDAPEASNIPADQSISCESDKPAVVPPTFTDDCDGDLDIFFSEIIPPGSGACSLTDSEFIQVYWS